MASKAQDGGERLWNLFRIVAWTGAAVVMLLPLVAMRFTDEVNWTGGDFIFAAVLIGGTGLVFELALRLTRNNAYRLGVCVALAAAFLTIWVSGAVGIIGSEDNPVNLLFGAVLLVALLGALAARLRPAGMAAAMFGAGLAHAAVVVFALVSGHEGLDIASVARALVFNGVFVGLWTASGALFRQADSGS